MLGFIECLFCLYWDYYMDCILYHVDVMHTINGHMLNCLYNIGIKYTQSCHITTSMCFCIQLEHFFFIYIHKDNCSVVCFCDNLWFWYQCNVGLIEWFLKFLSLLWYMLRRTNINSYLKGRHKIVVKTSSLGLCIFDWNLINDFWLLLVCSHFLYIHG
jgi:hypothetical protein